MCDLSSFSVLTVESTVEQIDHVERFLRVSLGNLISEDTIDLSARVSRERVFGTKWSTFLQLMAVDCDQDEQTMTHLAPPRVVLIEMIPGLPYMEEVLG